MSEEIISHRNLVIIGDCEYCLKFCRIPAQNFSPRKCIAMKFSVKILSAILLVMIVSSCACAALPSVTMLSTKTCPACTQMEKVMKEINAKYSGKITTSHIYLEDNPDIAKKYSIRYVPTLLFRDASGKIVAQEVGYKNLDEVFEVFRKAGVKF